MEAMDRGEDPLRLLDSPDLLLEFTSDLLLRLFGLRVKGLERYGSKLVCLTCGMGMPEIAPEACANCGTRHEMRPPVIGVNHLSQVLSALDAWAEEECSQEEFEGVFFQFAELFDELGEKWSFSERAFAERLSPHLVAKFAPQLESIDQALGEGMAGVGKVEAILAGEDDDFETVEDKLVGFFQGTCSASARLLDDLEKLGDL